MFREDMVGDKSEAVRRTIGAQGKLEAAAPRFILQTTCDKKDGGWRSSSVRAAHRGLI